MNKLPGKLALLRKSTGLPQTEIAAKLQIPVSEYLNWENGNSIPSISQSKQLADFFHVELAALLDNTMSFVAPQVESPLDSSVQIPFADNNKGTGSTQQMDTAQLNTVTPSSEDTGGQTRVMDTSTFTRMSNAADAEAAEESLDGDEEETKQTRKPVKEPSSKKKALLKNKTNLIIIASCIVAAIILVVVLLLTHGSSKSKSLSKSDTNRVALANQYSLYIGDSSIQARGTTPSNLSTFSNVVQVSAFADSAAGLKSDGTVVSTDSSLDLSDFTKITYIAAGTSHVAGVKKDGTVVCVGSSNGCKVSEWQNIKAVYAGDDVTVGLKEDGSFVSSGGVSIPSDVTGVTDVAISKEAVYYVNKNGTVSSIPLGSSTPLATNTLNKVTQIAAGDSILAGLQKDGTVEVVTDNDDIKTAVEKWKDVKYIAANGNTLIGITKNGKMYGAGDNTYNQYENTADSDTDSDSKDSTKLDSVKNIQFEVTTESLKITWDKVDHADSYEVVFNGGDASSVKDTSMSINASELQDGANYTVSITAKAGDKKYKDSDPTTTTYQYNVKTTQLNTPNGLNASVDSGGAWNLTWNPVDNATYYVITINGEQVDRIAGTSYTISGDALMNNTQYVIGVRAGSDDSKYTESGETQISTTYVAPTQKYEVTLKFISEDGTEMKTVTTTLDAGTYTGDQLLKAANLSSANYQATDATYTINSPGEVDVTVKTD